MKELKLLLWYVLWLLVPLMLSWLFLFLFLALAFHLAGFKDSAEWCLNVCALPLAAWMLLDRRDE